MDFLIPLAAKSLLIAGATLLLLQAMKRRSAADRSLVAHLGLLAILLLPMALVALPQLRVETTLLGTSQEAEAAIHGIDEAAAMAPKEVASSAATFPEMPQASAAASVDWAFWAYALPAALLVLLTLIALGRLIVLKSRAHVLVEPNWLTALARAQRRMGFKHGTALLTSDELSSPISWGLVRPVILLNREAADAHAQAEAIIAHELAHVARLDWLKLLLSRVTVALFWFNPLVWLLAREAHQLREETADDAVLESDIEDTDYAKLLVGIARHECRGMLLGAHGVAPARNSLARRVKRVLDVATARAPGGWRWSAAAAFFAAGMAVPVAALHLVPTTPMKASNVSTVGGRAKAPDPAIVPPTKEAVAALAAESAEPAEPSVTKVAQISTKGGKMVLRSDDGSTVTIYPADSKGRRKTVMRGKDGSTVAFADASAVPGLVAATAAAIEHAGDSIDRAIALKASGVSPAYAKSLRKAAPWLKLDDDAIVELASVGVTPDYLHDFAKAYPGIKADDVVEAKAMGISAGYAKSMASVGYGKLSIEQLAELKAVGVTPEDVKKYRKAAGKLPSVDKLVSLKALEVTPDDLNAVDSR